MWDIDRGSTHHIEKQGLHSYELQLGQNLFKLEAADESTRMEPPLPTASAGSCTLNVDANSSASSHPPHQHIGPSDNCWHRDIQKCRPRAVFATTRKA